MHIIIKFLLKYSKVDLFESQFISILHITSFYIQLYASVWFRLGYASADRDFITCSFAFDNFRMNKSDDIYVCRTSTYVSYMYQYVHIHRDSTLHRLKFKWSILSLFYILLYNTAINGEF